MTNDIIDDIYRRENENSRNRSCQLVKSCSMQCSTLQHVKTSSRLDNNLDMLFLKVNVTPSMKRKVKNESKRSEPDELNEYYTVHLAFDLLSKDVLSYPYSLCGCYDGRHFCSHVSVFMFLIRRTP